MKIDFYIMKATQYINVKQFICQLIEKIYNTGHPVSIQTEDNETARYYDEAIWADNPTSFIPHEINNNQSFQIDVISSNTRQKKILLNLTQQRINNLQEFSRLLQIVPNNQSIKKQARELYRHYQQQGNDIHTHHIEH